MIVMKIFYVSFQLPVADPFLEKVNLSDFGKFSNHPLLFLSHAPPTATAAP